MGLVLAVGMNFFSYFFSEKMALSMYNAQQLTPEIESDVVRSRGSNGGTPDAEDGAADAEALGDPRCDA